MTVKRIIYLLHAHKDKFLNVKDIYLYHTVKRFTYPTFKKFYV